MTIKPKSRAFLQNEASYIRHAHHVGKDTGGGDGGTGTVAADDHRGVVASGSEADNVVRAFELVERVTDGNFAQADAAFAVFPLSDVAPALPSATKR